jgi:diaminopimelate epimerase
MNIEKHHGTGNDFFVIDAGEPVADRRALAIDLCHGDDGLAAGKRVGADGVLFLALEERYASPRVVMTLVQPDGSTAPMCGNGARCAAAWAAERTRAGVVMVDTQAGTRRATIDDEGVTVEMGPARFTPKAVPLAGNEPLIEEKINGLAVTAVDIGVPHAVAFVDDVSTTDLASLAPPVRHADRFPRGANVTLASPCEVGPASDGEGDVDGREASISSFDQRTYERGVEGETRSCGTGAVAVAAVARELGMTERDSIPVHPPGGRLDVRFTGRGATLTGPTEREFAGRVSMGASPTVEATEAAGD